jgi:predicted N-acyltransferase
VDPRAWNCLVGSADPFLEHEFLAALERSGVIGHESAWRIRFVVAFEGDRPTAALPFFLKYDSYGEFVFDWSWAEAYQRVRIPYYPKLIAAAPLTPVSGSRLLGDAKEGEVWEPLFQYALAVAREEGASGLHFLFPEREELEFLTERGFHPRIGQQFHWLNDGYGSFADFLSALRSSKRKQIMKERRAVAESGLEIQTLVGDEVRPEHMDALWRFYADTAARHGSMTYLGRTSFFELGDRFRERLVLVVAKRSGEVVAGTLNARKGERLYGRYWGASEDVPFLHFECCYYRLIDYAIEHRLARVEAGAQGEHKFLRGYVARPTYSAHKLLLPAAHAAIGEWLEHERPRVLATVEAYNRQSPVKGVRARGEPGR